VNAVSVYVRRERPSVTVLEASSFPVASKMAPRSAERCAAMTCGLSERAASRGASSTCHQVMLPSTTANASSRYPPSRRTFAVIIRRPPLRRSIGG
jgi:hypothetical protein